MSIPKESNVVFYHPMDRPPEASVGQHWVHAPEAAGQLSYGDPKDFLGEDAQQLAAAGLSSTTAVVAYRDGENLDYGACKVATVSGLDLTFGARKEFESATSTARLAVCKLSSDSFLLAYSKVDYQLVARVGTVVGANEITYGPEHEVRADCAPSVLRAVALPGGAFLLAYQDAPSGGGTSQNLVALVGTAAGTDITLGAEAVSDAEAAYFAVAPTAPSDGHEADRVVAVYQHYGSSYQLRYCVADLDGAALTWGAVHDFPELGYGPQLQMAGIGPRVAVVYKSYVGPNGNDAKTCAGLPSAGGTVVWDEAVWLTQPSPLAGSDYINCRDIRVAALDGSAYVSAASNYHSLGGQNSCDVAVVRATERGPDPDASRYMLDSTTGTHQTDPREVVAMGQSTFVVFGIYVEPSPTVYHARGRVFHYEHQSFGSAQVGTGMSGGQVMETGPPTELSVDASEFIASIAWLDDSRAVVAWHGSAYVVEVSGQEVVSVGSPVAIGGNNVHVVAMDSNTVVFGYNTWPTYIYSKVGTVTGADITLGPETTLNGNSETYLVALVALNGTMLAAAWTGLTQSYAAAGYIHNIGGPDDFEALWGSSTNVSEIYHGLHNAGHACAFAAFGSDPATGRFVSVHLSNYRDNPALNARAWSVTVSHPAVTLTKYAETELMATTIQAGQALHMSQIDMVRMTDSLFVWAIGKNVSVWAAPYHIVGAVGLLPDDVTVVPPAAVTQRELPGGGRTCLVELLDGERFALADTVIRESQWSGSHWHSSRFRVGRATDPPYVSTTTTAPATTAPPAAEVEWVGPAARWSPHNDPAYLTCGEPFGAATSPVGDRALVAMRLYEGTAEDYYGATGAWKMFLAVSRISVDRAAASENGLAYPTAAGATRLAFSAWTRSAVGDLGKTSPPTVSPGLVHGATQVSGTCAEADGTFVQVHANGSPVGTTASVTGGVWIKSGLPALSGGDSVQATARAVGKLESPSSAAVTVAGGPGTTTTAPPSLWGDAAPLGSKATDFAVAPLSSTQFVVCYATNDGGGDATAGAGKARVATASGSDVTFGPEEEFAASIASGGWIAAMMVDPTKFVVFYTASAAGKLRVGGVAGDAIGFGSEVEFSAAVARDTTATMMDTAQFVVCWVDDSAGQCWSRAGSVAGLDVTFGGQSAAEVYPSANDPCRACASAKLTSSLLVLCYLDTDHMRVLIGEVGFYAVTWSSPWPKATTFMADRGLSVAALAADRFIVCVADEATKSARFYTGTVTTGPVNITFNDEGTFLGPYGLGENIGHRMSVAAYGGTDVVACYTFADSAGYHVKTTRGTVDGGNNVAWSGSEETLLPVQQGQPFCPVTAVTIDPPTVVACYSGQYPANIGQVRVSGP